MARVSLIERARARTRRAASSGVPLSTWTASRSVGATGNPVMHLAGHRPDGGQVASPVVRQYMAGHRSVMYPPGIPGVPDPTVGYPSPDVRFRSVGTISPQRMGWWPMGPYQPKQRAATGCTSHGQCGPLQECKDGACVDMDLVSRPAGSTRRRALRRRALGRRASVGGCGCEAY